MSESLYNSKNAYAFSNEKLRDIFINNTQVTNYIFSDLNVRDDFVTDSTDTMIYDTKVVVQSLWRLINTEEGEIPYFRDYGLGIKRFVQYPLNTETVNFIFNYVKNKVTIYEARADIIKAEVDVEPTDNTIKMNFIIRVKSTGDMIKLPTWIVQVGSPI